MALVLASGSKIRAELMENAGLVIEIDPADVDERAVEAPLLEAGFPPEDLASVLAEAKANDVSGRRQADLVVGADQILAFEGERRTKPDDMEAARRQLLAFSGKTHELHSAVVISQNGEAVWRQVSTARLTMRDLTPEFIGHYLAAAGDDVLSSVGAYQLEGLGVQLFEKIEGDYFTILGLPMLPLLAELRTLKVIET
ncbi:septum formation protein [Labrenzia sp. EL_13]|uniref:Maf-like protein n=1 Tax=Roseibium album TaxID=311410 RepID=UPI000CF08140|nr:Maf-like protein [Roseibium album]MBG6145560.1 septum formation protein [Labrenzia sp. EL_142]MBG6157744.1 septum formation protein [Labrenzia sp. EL_162]MBG6163174.1 septum formation protein [Labrenzia sp. EL_195]MBG6195863.1 septum formation protein [Labrenzia sp. EL_159]MBG6201287.1 septum formation protein [Labrenzia sp. EL_13]MBG6209054.1 septum formation protein [Labrenzia sp. EL_126]MCR9055938.1 Maf-like protein [Paracoccaceae bacterium]